MKKISLILAAFALVLGISQCRKQETPMGKLVTQDVTFTSSFNNGAKFDVDNTTNPAALKLKWEAGDIIKVTDNATPANVSTLTCTEVSENGKSGTFTGTITCQENASLTFSYNPIDYQNQDGSLQIYLEGTSPYHENGIYELEMKMPCAVLKLDVSAFADDTKKDGVTVTIKAGGETVASVSGVKNDAASKELYVAVKVDETPAEKSYTFSGNGMIASCNGWKLEANTFYTEKGGDVPTGNAIKIVAKAPEFSVSSTTKVEFAPGNLYWDGSSWRFEANQWDTNPPYSETQGGCAPWDMSHVCHLSWSNTTDWQTSGLEPYAYEYSYIYSTQTMNDVFFTNSSEMTANPNFHVNGEAGDNVWRTLSCAEWKYLLGYDSGKGQRTDNYGRPDAIGKRAYKDLKDLNDVYGLVILPDNVEASVMNYINSTSDLAAYGAVFLPAAGNRYRADVLNVGLGFYWSSTPSGSDNSKACYMMFALEGVFVGDYVRGDGFAVRLVRQVQ